MVFFYSPTGLLYGTPRLMLSMCRDLHPTCWSVDRLRGVGGPGGGGALELELVPTDIGLCEAEVVNANILRQSASF